MTENSAYLRSYNKIKKLIDSSRFNEAFLLLKNQLRQFPGLRKEMEKLLEVERNYRYMLDYIADGHNDPYHQDVVKKISDELLKANDIALRQSKLTDSSDQYSSIRRIEVMRKSSFAAYLEEFRNLLEEDRQKKPENEETVSEKQAKKIDDIFNYVWTMGLSSSEDYESISKSISDPDLPIYFKSLLLSAILLGNIEYFDPDSFEILLNVYEETEDINLKAKAVVGIVLISLLHPQRLSANMNLKSRMMLLAEDETNKKLVNQVLYSILRTYDTKRIDNKMRNDVIPGLMKLKPDIINKLRDMAADAEEFLSEENPQWEELLENSNLGEKLQEINDLQLEGADVMVTAFSNLKGFPFFNTVSNWFLPFLPGYYEFSDITSGDAKDTFILFSELICESDLNSYILSLKSMPEEQRGFMLNNMSQQLKEAKEAMTSAVGETDNDRISKKIKHNLQDIYRFFKYYRRKNDFKDPFGLPFVASQIEPLMPLLGSQPEDISLLAEFYFKNNYYGEAAGMFELADHLQSDTKAWDKIGFCHDRLGDYEKAVEWYQKADLINPGNQWLEKKLAMALKNSGKPEEAIKYYESALKREPENYHLLMSAGQSLLELGKTTDALARFYHAQYLKPDKPDAIRAIAWTELLAGNLDKAEAQYEKVLTHPQADKTDFLNAGHCALARGDFKKAIYCYRTFVDRTPNREMTPLLLALKDDNKILKSIGVKTSDLRLIIDKIRYDLSAD